MRNLPNWVWAAVVLAVVSSLVSVQQRVSVESRNKATAIALDISVVESLTVTTGSPLVDSLKGLSESGLNAVAISEDSLGEALALGVVRIDPRSTSDTDFARAPVAITGPPEWMGRVRAGLEARFPKITLTHESASTSYDRQPKKVEKTIWIPVVPVETLRGVSLGLNPATVRAAKEANMFVIARHANPVGSSASTVRWLIDQDKRLGVDAYLPEGEQVLGQRELVKEVADQLVAAGIRYCTPEFAKIGGNDKLASLLPENLLQLHSIQAAEVDKMSPAEVVERFSKAARERNVRVLLVRPISGVSADPGLALRESVSLIRKGLAKEGVPLGVPKPFSDTHVNRVVFVFIGFAVAAAGLACLHGLTASFAGRLIGSALLFGAFAASVTDSLRWATALAAALIFPVLAYQWLESRRQFNPFVAALAISAISLTGGLCVAGLLNGLPYFVRVDQFTAVKLAHFAPIVVIAYILLSRRVEVKSLLARPSTWGGIMGGLGVLVVLMFMLARTGNDNPAAVSGFELKLRSLLDWLLYTRPRTKEFVMGHPALIIGLMMEAKVRSGAWRSEGVKLGAAGMLALGAIGQTSIVNTMCHLHTPVLLSLARIGIGLAMGLAVGYALWFALTWWKKPGATAA
jgi:hypothetical protein